MVLEKMLEKFGLNEKEAKMYLAALELGYASMQKIAKKAGINRTTGYVILDSLVKKGLMSHFIQGKKRLFVAEPPEQVLMVLEKKKEQFEEKRKEFEKVLPELKGMYNLSETKPHVRFFEGIEGVKTIQEELFKGGEKEALSFVSLDDLYNVFPNYDKDYVSRRVVRGVKMRSIYTTSRGKLPASTGSKVLREARYIPKDKFPFHCTFSIRGNKVALMSYKKHIFGVVIDSQMIAESMRALFEIAWEGAKKYN